MASSKGFVESKMNNGQLSTSPFKLTIVRIDLLLEMSNTLSLYMSMILHLKNKHNASLQNRESSLNQRPS